MDSLHNDSHLIFPPLDLKAEAVFPAFLFATLCYLIILFCNLTLIIVIVMKKSLHQPMYLILLNLPINDIIGSTAFFTEFIRRILSGSRSIIYSSCVTQAFLIHIYAAATILILTAMAYDRYVAICFPLKYNTLMTYTHVMRVILAVWLLCVLMIGLLFFLLLRLPRCGTHLRLLYCDNPSLLALVCADTTINNIFGLLIVAVTQVFANAIILYTYLSILITCFRSKRSDTKTKALQTCATHLTVYLLLECLGLFTIISYRIKGISPRLRMFFGAWALIFPPAINPVIYGLKTKEIREKILQIFRRKRENK